LVVQSHRYDDRGVQINHARQPQSAGIDPRWDFSFPSRYNRRHP
jgi:hypothetical protein